MLPNLELTILKNEVNPTVVIDGRTTENRTTGVTADIPAANPIMLAALKHMADTIASSTALFAQKTVLNQYTHVQTASADIGPIRNVMEVYRQISAYDGMDELLQRLSEKLDSFSPEESARQVKSYLVPLLEQWHEDSSPQSKKNTHLSLGISEPKPKLNPLPLDRERFVTLFRQVSEELLKSDLPIEKEKLRRLVMFAVRGGLARALKEKLVIIAKLVQPYISTYRQTFPSDIRHS